MNKVTLKDHPEIAALVKLVSKKRTAYAVRNKASVTLDGTYWDEGSRSEYFLVNTATKRITPLGRFSPPQFGGPARTPEHVIEPGFVVIEAGVSSGKPSTPTIYFPD